MCEDQTEFRYLWTYLRAAVPLVVMALVTTEMALQTVRNLNADSLLTACRPVVSKGNRAAF